MVKVYSYPLNWWNTISYTEWKVSWFEDGLYKIDANIDLWSSWGWVFNSDWELIWIVSFVKTWKSSIWYVIPVWKIKEFEGSDKVKHKREYGSTKCFINFITIWKK